MGKEQCRTNDRPLCTLSRAQPLIVIYFFLFSAQPVLILMPVTFEYLVVPYCSRLRNYPLRLFSFETLLVLGLIQKVCEGLSADLLSYSLECVRGQIKHTQCGLTFRLVSVLLFSTVVSLCCCM